MSGPPRPCEEKDRLRKVYVEALHELREATRVLNFAQYGPAFQDALAKTQQARTKCDGATMLHWHREENECCQRPTTHLKRNLARVV